MLLGRTNICLFIALLTVSAVGDAKAAQVGILPPDLDYQKVCVVREKLQKDDFNWTGKTPATSNLPPEHLLQLAHLYYNGNGQVAPDYEFARKIVDYLLKQTGQIKNEALFIKYDMYLKGKGLPQNTDFAKDVLNELIHSQDPRAYSRYGELYADEGDYLKAIGYFQKAFANDEPSAALSIAYMYHDKKISATQDEIDKSIIQAQDASMSYLVRGNCHSLTLFGLMYARLNNIPKAEYYSAMWYEKAALLDEWAPKLALAAIIQRGYALPYNEARIIKLWQEAAALGSDRAMFLLGEHALLNHKNDEELKNAELWLKKSATRHNVKAMEMLAALYDGRYPEIADKKKQQRWLEEALKSADVKPKTIMQLAALYTERNDIPPEKIFELYQMAAAKGNNDAYLKLGDSYRYGLGADSFPAHALRYYRIAASQGETSAMEALEQAYSCGIGVEKNPEQANVWQRQINYYNSVPTLSRAYGFLVSPPDDKAKWKEMEDSLKLLAITRENSEATILLGLMFAKAGDKSQAKEWLARALVTDDKNGKDYEAHAILGKIKLEGQYTDQDVKDGVMLLEKAGKAGNPDAQNVLGKWYKEQGELEKAKSYYRAAGEAGKTSAFTKLADIEIQQGHVPSAISYLETAAHHHDIGAMLKLAGGYEEKGWTKTPDLVKSRFWFDQALKNYPCKTSDIVSISEAYAKGRYGLAQDEAAAESWMNKVGDSEPADDKEGMNIAKAILSSNLAKDTHRKEKALSILETMALNGHAEAASMLASLYLDHSFGGNDPRQALKWITKSAENGDVKSMLELANMYMSGYGVPASTDTALNWLEKAASAGNAEAAQRLKDLKTVRPKS